MGISSLVFNLAQNQITWAAVITCPNSGECIGTSGNDIIMGTTGGGIIRALGGDDKIVGAWNDHNTIEGGSGNDILIGGQLDDVLFGGLGNDKYDGRGGHDALLETFDSIELHGGNDDMSGNRGNDYIQSGGGADIIFGGPGNDQINNSLFLRDFERDTVDCGSGTDLVETLYSGDGDTAVFCETVHNGDG